MSFVFVSHATPDKRTHVRPLVQALAIEGVSLWLDRPGSGPNDFQLPPEFVLRHRIQYLSLGQDWDHGIKSALRDAGAVLICLSKAALEPGLDVLGQEMWGAQYARKAVTCIVDDLDPSAMPQRRGLLSLGASQSLRIDTETLGMAIDWLSADASRTPDHLPKEFQLAWQDVRRLRDDLHRTRDEAQSASPSQSSGRYRWPTHWNFSAYMADKREAFEGRDWLFEEIAQWQAAGHSRAMLIRGDFGVGKSALISELVHRNPGGSIAAWHFCQHDTQETLQPGAFVRSLAAQFAATVPGYKDLIDADPALQERLDRAPTDPGSALEGAVLAPLARLPAPPEPRLLVVDGLDEALELDTAGPRNTGTIISLLATKARRFPLWLRVLVTSRPNPQVLTPLNAFGTKQIDAECAGNQDDLRRYILGRCAREPLAGVLRGEGYAAESLAALLVQRSAGKFLYATRALGDLENGHLRVATLEMLPPGMDTYYLEAFDRRFVRAGCDYESARRLLGVLSIAREPLPTGMLAAVLDMSEADVRAVHKTLPDYLRWRAGKLTFDHLYMAEWLTGFNEVGFARAGNYTIDFQASQAAVRRWALRQVADGAAHLSDYLLRHMQAHLDGDEERVRIYSELMFERAEWLQARLNQAGIEALFGDAQLLGGLPRQEALLAVLRNSSLVLREFPNQLPAQILGRIGDGLGPRKLLNSLSQSVRHRRAAALARTNAMRVLLPDTPSLKLNAGLHTLSGTIRTAPVVLPNGRVVSAGEGGKVILWDPDSMTETVLCEGNGKEVNKLAVRGDGFVAAGGDDHYLRVWDTRASVDPLVIDDHLSPIYALTWLVDGRIASGGMDGTVRIIDPRRQAKAVALDQVSGRILELAALADGRIVSGGGDGMVRVWDPNSSVAPVVFAGHTDLISSLAVLRTGHIVSGSFDKTVRVWNVANPDEMVVFEGHTDTVQDLAVLRDGRIASASDDCTIRIWDPQHRLAPEVLVGHTGGVMSVTILADWRLASGGRDHTVRVWELQGTGYPLVFVGHTAWVRGLAPLSDGRVVSTSDDKTTRVWDPKRPITYEASMGHTYAVLALAVLPDERVASAGRDRTVQVWEPRRNIEPYLVDRRQDYWIDALAVLADGRIASAGGYTVRVCDPTRRAMPIVLEGHTDGVLTLAALPDGRVASGGFDNSVRIWDPRSGDEPVVLDGHKQWVNMLVALPRERLVSCGSDAAVRVWDLRTHSELHVFTGHVGSVYVAALLIDGRIASGGHDGTVRVWDPWHNSESVVLSCHAAPVRALIVHLDGRIASADRDGTVRICNPWKAEDDTVLQGHIGWVNALAALPDGKLASGGGDHTVRIWDVSKKRQVSMFVADAAVNCLVVAAGQLVAGCDDGAVHFLREYMFDEAATPY